MAHPSSATSPRFSRIVYGTWRLLDDPAAAAPEPIAARLEACAELGLTTIAEGITEGRQLDALRTLGCELGQGYLFGAPQRSAEIASRLVAASGLEDARGTEKWAVNQ